MRKRAISSLTASLIIVAIMLLALAVSLTMLQGPLTKSSTSNSTHLNSLTTNSTSSSNSSVSDNSLITNSTTNSSSSSSKSVNSSSSSASIGGVKLVSYNDPVYDSIYDSFNGYGYLLNPNDNLQILFPSNGTISNLSNLSSSSFPTALGYNASNGKIYALTIENDIGCDVGYVGGYNGSTPSRGAGLGPGLASANMAYDSKYHYLGFAAGAFNDDPVFGGCDAGLYVWTDNNSQFYVYTGPRSSGRFPSWYTSVPALAYNSINGDMYVPVLNYSMSNSQVLTDATYLYTVRNFTALSTNSTLQGITQRLVFDPANQYLYCEQYFTSNRSTFLVAFNVTSGSVIGSVKLTDNSSIVYDSKNQMIYVFEKNKILEISNAKVIHSYNEPTNSPSSAFYDSKDDELVDFYSSPSPKTTQTTELGSTSPIILVLGLFTFLISDRVLFSPQLAFFAKNRAYSHFFWSQKIEYKESKLI
ncbi:MAG: hypothetical protein ACYCQJ_01095 [Nitrososphaerales archaeon]